MSINGRNKTKFGNINSGNYSEFLPDGTLKNRGESTVWKDMVMDLFGRRLTANQGTADYDFEEQCINFSANGDISDSDDRIGGNQEINHDMLVGNGVEFRLHIHWWQQVTNNTVATHTFDIEYRIQNNGFGKATAWEPLTITTGGASDVWDFTSEVDGLYNQITKANVSIIADVDISDTIQLRLTRTDAVSGIVAVYFLDIHAKVDSQGSDDEIAKTT